MSIRLVSIDIGKKNFAQYVEDCSVDKLLQLEKEYNSIPTSHRRKVKGVMNAQIENIIHEIYLSGTRVQTGVYDLRKDKTSDNLDMDTRVNLLLHLDKYEYLWTTCDIFVIEQQYFKTWSGRKKRSAGTEANVDAIKIGEATLMWFLERYPFKKTMYFGSQFKTQILGAPWKMTKHQRKKWSEAQTRKIYEMRKDTDMIELFCLQDRIYRKHINTDQKIQTYLASFKGEDADAKVLAKKVVRERQKLDDIGDACTQAQAFKFKHMVACF
uniref:Holliday junction resolvase n=1 Tax=Marseillevirus LCMAC102 TaxID=2506603 RepID=A0A481YVJ8_9VIRU|nr:MAG: holliday junction resolvase [Marseillevirus LCMAC102]